MTQELLTAIAEEHIAGASGLRLFVRSWRPDVVARAAVVIVHGFNSHSAYYRSAAEELTAAGCAVYALDLRGRGQSEGERFQVEQFEQYVSDVGRLVMLTKVREPGLPMFMLGHGAGAIVACLYAVDHPKALAGLICEGLAYQLPAPNLAFIVLKGLSHFAPHAHIIRLKNEDFTRDPRALQIMNDDPLIANEVQPLPTVAAMVRADERLKHEFSRLATPLLILHGTDDRAAKPAGSRTLFDSAASRDRTLKLYEGALHDLLNDIGREAVLADITRWIDARIATRH